MTISLTTLMANDKPLFVYNASPNGPNFTQLHIDLINSDPQALAFYTTCAANNTPITIGTGIGTFYNIAANTIVIDPLDFSAIPAPVNATALQLAQNQLANAASVVIRGVHEAEHRNDQNDSTPIPGTGGYATPGAFAIATAPTEGVSVAAEVRVDHAFIGKTYIINGIAYLYTRLCDCAKRLIGLSRETRLSSAHL